MKTSTKHTVLFLLLAGSILLLLSGCKYIKSQQMHELEQLADTVQIQSGIVVDRQQRDREKVLGKPVYANIRIIYKPVDNYTKQDVYREIITVLEQNNWEGKVCEGCTTDYYTAGLQQGNYPIPIRAKVRVSKEDNTVSLYFEHPKP